MNKNNLFKYADKELVIDAFLCWLINEMNQDYLLELKNSFLKDFLALNHPLIENVTGLEATKQVKNVDVVCTLKTTEGEKKVIFENKMYSSEHSKQLNRYKEQNPDAHKFIYLKFGYVHRIDKNAANSMKYEIKRAKDFSNLIKPHFEEHLFIKEFYDYLNVCFVEPQSQFESYLINNKFEQLDNASFQHFIMEKIREQLKNKGWDDKNLKFKIGNNPDGRPWTQLDFSQIKKKYGKFDETLFFRLDKGSGKNYLRINLYSQQGKKYWNEKKPRLDKLRKVAEEVTESANLISGDYYDKAKNEVETLILFFEDGNPIQTVINESVKFAVALRDAHQKLA